MGEYIFDRTTQFLWNEDAVYWPNEGAPPEMNSGEWKFLSYHPAESSPKSINGDPIQYILTGERESPETTYDPYFDIGQPYSSNVGEMAEGGGSRYVAATLAFLATKIVCSHLPRESQTALLQSPPSTAAEAQNLLKLLQSQPQRRGRPKKLRSHNNNKANQSLPRSSAPRSSAPRKKTK